MSDNLKLKRKLFLARKATKAVAKEGEADWGNFARYEDVLKVAEEQLRKRDIIWIPSMVEEALHFGKDAAIAKAVFEYEVIDTKTGESLTVRFAGTGHDSPGDKALFKASTGTHKYFLRDLLSIPFGTDPEAEAGAGVATALTVSSSAGTQKERFGPGLINLRDLAASLEASGLASDDEAMTKLLADCEIEPNADGLLAPVTTEQCECLHFEIQRLKQDASAEKPDVTPKREKPLPDSDLPEPDWTDLAKPEAAGV